MINEDFEYYFEKYGMPESEIPVTSTDIANLSVDMPPLYSTLLERHGTFTQRSGMFKFIRTDSLSPISKMLFAGDRDFGDEKAQIFCFSVFGALYFWHPAHGLGFVDLVKGEVTCYNLTSGEKRPSGELFFGPFDVPFSMENESYDLFDDQDKPLFKRALKKLGPAQLMECYGFVPALAFGGDAILENLKKLSAPEHFAILAQATEFSLVKSEDYGETTRVRRIAR
jgi:hypothetical protein